MILFQVKPTIENIDEEYKVHDKSFLLYLYISLTKLLFFLTIVFRDICALFTSKKNDKKLNHLDIEPTNICTANCVFCAYQYQEGKFYKKIDDDFVDRLVDSFCSAGGGDIGLTPIVGDPLVSPDIVKLVSKCRSRKEINQIGLTTNGHLLTSEKFIELRDAGITNIVISMTYPDEKEYKTIYRSTQYKQLIDNLNKLMLIDKKQVNIALAIRTPRLFWGNNPLFKKAKLQGWEITRNLFFDDWSGSVTDGLKKNHLLKRPLRGKHLPCTMLQSGPHAMASGKITACGCRDLEGKSELSDPKLFAPFYESASLEKVYYGTMDTLRNRFLNGTLPTICATCRHYNPEYRFASLKDKLIQICADLKAGLHFIFVPDCD